VAGFGRSTSVNSKRREAKERAGSVAKWRKQNREEIAKRGGPNSASYQDSIRDTVEKLGILEPASSVRQTEEIFENPDGSRRSVDGIVRGFGSRDIEIIDTPSGKVAVDHGFKSDAAPNSRAAKAGIEQAELSNLAQVRGTPIDIRETAGNVDDWINDPVARARYFPEDVDLTTATPAETRARAIGMAEASGDREAVIAANKRYSFSDEEASALASRLLIKGKPLRQQVRLQGLPDDRRKLVIDPATGRQVSTYPKAAQQQYFFNRGDSGVHTWLEGGGTGWGDGRSNIAVPGNEYQLEHYYPFSGSIDAVGPTGSNYYSDELDNIVGYYERHENAEKAEIDPTDYYRTKRLHAKAKDMGINLTGVAKQSEGEILSGLELLNYIVERDNPSTIRGDRRRKDWKDEFVPERAAQNKDLVDFALSTPVVITETGPGDVNVSF